MAAAVCHLPSGDFCSARATPSASSRGVSGRSVRRSGAGWVRCCCNTTASLRCTKGGTPRYALEEHAAERVDVAPVVDLLERGDLLGAHVGGGADRDPGAGEPVAARGRHRSRDAEIEEDRPLRTEDDVLRLHVPVDDAVAVGMVDGIEQVVRQPDGFGEGEAGHSPKLLPQGRTLHVRHDVVDDPVQLARIQQPGDARVLEPGREPDLPEEAIARDTDQELRVEHLEGDPLPLPVRGEIDPRVPALADLSLDLILPLEGPLNQREHVTRNGSFLDGRISKVAPQPLPRKSGIRAEFRAGRRSESGSGSPTTAHPTRCSPGG